MIQINIATANGFSAEELQKVEDARVILNTILNSDKFKERVLRFTTEGLFRFHFRRSFLGSWIDKPYSNHQVYEIITQNAGPDKPVIKHVGLHLELLPGGEAEHAGHSDKHKIYTYSTWFNNVSVAEYASHLSHEWCHQLGFDHAEKHDDKRNHSVPFGISSITRAIVLNY